MNPKQLQMEKWLSAASAPPPQAKELTKEIAAQIIKSRGVEHTSRFYTLRDEDILSPEELAMYCGLYSWGECVKRWTTLKGRSQAFTVQATVETMVAEARVVAVVSDINGQALNVVAKDEQAKAYPIFEGIPAVTGGLGIMSHKVASMYYLLNPPYHKGEQVSVPLEPADGLYAPSKVVAMRTFDPEARKWDGMFENAYKNVGMTSAHVEAVINDNDVPTQKRVVAKVMTDIGPTFNISKREWHRVFDFSGNTPMICTSKMVPQVSLDFERYWRTMIGFNVVSRVKSAFEPFYCMVLPRGVAPKVHVIGNLRWILRASEVAGVSGASSSSVWQQVKSMAVMNMPVSTNHSIVPLGDPVNDAYLPGEYAPFSPAMEIIDMGGMSAPVLLKTQSLSFSPARPGDSLVQLAKVFSARGHDFKRVKLGVVSYFHPSLFSLGWGIFPLHLGEGKVLCVYGVDGFTKEDLLAIMSRFALYRMIFPYARVVWPVLASEFSFAPVIVKNGAPKHKEGVKAEVYQFDVEMEPMDLAKLDAYMPPMPEQFHIPVPVQDEIELPPVVPLVATVAVTVETTLGVETPAPEATATDFDFDGIFVKAPGADAFAGHLANRKKKKLGQETAPDPVKAAPDPTPKPAPAPKPQVVSPTPPKPTVESVKPNPFPSLPNPTTTTTTTKTPSSSSSGKKEPGPAGRGRGGPPKKNG